MGLLIPLSIRLTSEPLVCCQYMTVLVLKLCMKVTNMTKIGNSDIHLTTCGIWYIKGTSQQKKFAIDIPAYHIPYRYLQK